MIPIVLDVTRELDMSVIAVPMPFVGITGIRQWNAMRSWQRMSILGYINLCGPDVCAQEVDSWGHPSIQYLYDPCIQMTDEFGTPLISSVFKLGQYTGLDLCAYINSDVMVVGLDGAAQVCEEGFNEFLMIGRRWDVDIDYEWNFSPGWDRRLESLVQEEGSYHSPGAIDWFVFTNGLYPDGTIPPFAIGRSAWDNWLVISALKRGIPVIDASPVTLTVHQNKDAKVGKPLSEERKKQRERNRMHYDLDRDQYSGSSKNATWILDSEGLHEK